MRLIDADKIVYYESIDADTLAGTGKLYAPRELIDAMPTIEERKKGKWINSYKRQTCSVCKQRGYRSWNFCPNCGADMRGDQNED